MSEDLEIKYVPADSLTEYKGNSRTHSEAQVEQIAASIKAFGFTNPILVDESETIIAGHGRLQAAKKLKMKMVPVIVLVGLSKVQIKALVIADNKLATNAGWDEALLITEIESLIDLSFNTDVLGFDDDELDLLLGREAEELDEPEPETSEDEAFKNMTFNLHKDQTSIIEDAITLGRCDPVVDTGLNDNANSNALALICQQWLELKDGK